MYMQENFRKETFSPIEATLADIILPNNNEKEIFLANIHDNANKFINEQELNIPPNNIGFINITGLNPFKIRKAISIGNYMLKYGAAFFAPNESAFTIFEILISQLANDSENIISTLNKIEGILNIINDNCEQIQQILELIRNINLSNQDDIEELIELIKNTLGILEPFLAPASFINTRSQEFALNYFTEGNEPYNEPLQLD